MLSIIAKTHSSYHIEVLSHNKSSRINFTFRVSQCLFTVPQRFHKYKFNSCTLGVKEHREYQYNHVSIEIFSFENSNYYVRL